MGSFSISKNFPSLYTDDSKALSGATGSGRALFDTQTTPFRNFETAVGSCFLAEIFDAELHAIHEGLLYLDASDLVPQNLFICIDNSAAITDLQENAPKSEPAREASKAAHSLSIKGWNISTIWTPAYLDIKGNESADEKAKQGALDITNLCSMAQS
jgi:hypothetical protein